MDTYLVDEYKYLMKYDTLESNSELGNELADSNTNTVFMPRDNTVLLYKSRKSITL